VRACEKSLSGGSSCERVGKMIPPISVTYFRRLTDEYMWIRNSSPAPHIFVGVTMSPPNIYHVYSSMM
jgi:hypothetical protein